MSSRCITPPPPPPDILYLLKDTELLIKQHWAIPPEVFSALSKKRCGWQQMFVDNFPNFEYGGNMARDVTRPLRLFMRLCFHEQVSKFMHYYKQKYHRNQLY